MRQWREDDAALPDVGQMCTERYAVREIAKRSRRALRMQQRQERSQAGRRANVAGERAEQEHEGEDDKPEKTLGAYLYLRKQGWSSERAKKIIQTAAELHGEDD